MIRHVMKKLVRADLPKVRKPLWLITQHNPGSVRDHLSLVTVTAFYLDEAIQEVDSHLYQEIESMPDLEAARFIKHMNKTAQVEYRVVKIFGGKVEFLV